jgi:predicted secreted protein
MQRSLITFVLGILSINLLFAQKELIQWEETFGDNYNEHIESIIQTAEGGYIFTGWTSSKGAGGKDVWIVKLDKNGKKQWEKAYGDVKEDKGIDIAEIKRGYVVLAYKESKNEGYADTWIFKVDEGGNMKWEQTIWGSEKDHVNVLLDTKDNEYALAGAKEQKGDHDLNMWLIKTNNRGKMLWQGLSDTRYLDDEALAIYQIPDQGYLLAGYIKNKKGIKNGFLKKFDIRGNNLWSKEYGGEQNDELTGIVDADNGRFLLCGTTHSKGKGGSDLWLVKVDKNGRTEWEKTFGGFSDDVATQIGRSKYGFLISGYTASKSKGGYDYWIMEVDKQGKLKWEQRFGSAKKEMANRFIITKDNGILLAGTAVEEESEKSDGYIIKLHAGIENAPSNLADASEMNTKSRKGKNEPKGDAKIKIQEPVIREGFKTVINKNQFVLKGTALSKKGIESISVNGKEVMFHDNGSFSSIVPLNVGNNKISIKVKERDNSISERVISIARAANLKSDDDITLEQVAGKYYALLIGVEDYMDPDINNLDKPIDDATQLYNTLTAYYTFNEEHVKVLKNPTRAEIIVALDEISQKIKPEDNFVLFYAGHGYWDPDKELGYWLPADAMRSNTANWLRNSTVRDYISSIKSKHTLLIADACFSGGIFKTRSAFNSNTKAINKLYDLPSRKAMTSGTLKEVSDKSAFIKYLNKRLIENNNKYITSERLFSEFRTAVLNNSNNVPQYGTIQQAGDEGGEFIFIRK